MKIVTIVGARPQFIKAALLSVELARRGCFERLVHTGQHYDFGMSGVFFEELSMQQPDYFLGVGSAPHGAQTGEMMKRLEPVMEAESPAWVVVFGDTNSTLAGALVAAKLKIPIAHVEAGLRSFQRDMPEEINRVVADHLSRLLLAPTPNAARQLHVEGVAHGVHVVGDIMVDLVLRTAAELPEKPDILNRFDLQRRRYGLLTIHRASNTEDQPTFERIISGLSKIPFPVIFPVHPRTAQLAAKFADRAPNITTCEPLSYLDTVALAREARVVITDSGGLQKEAYALAVPCVTLREETEWIETLAEGWNVLAGSDPQRIQTAALRSAPDSPPAEVFGNGKSASRIAELLIRGSDADQPSAAGLASASDQRALYLQNAV